MHYQISRNGQMYGPYTLEDLQRYLASGNVLATDLAKSEEMADWLPVSQILAGPAATASSLPPSSFTGAAATPASDPGTPYTSPAGNQVGAPIGTPVADPAARFQNFAASSYPEAPNLHWGLVLLFAFLTCSLFMFVWNLVIAAWLKRVQPNATSLYYYLGAAVLLVLQMFAGIPYSLHHAMSPGIHAHTGNSASAFFGIAVWVVRLIARYSQRASLEEHYNGPEPIGLRLDPVMTFFFGGVYFQYHLNRINQMKLAARYGAIRTF